MMRINWLPSFGWVISGRVANPIAHNVHAGGMTLYSLHAPAVRIPT